MLLRNLYLKFVYTPRLKRRFRADPEWVRLDAEAERRFAATGYCAGEILEAQWAIERKYKPAKRPWMLRPHRWSKWTDWAAHRRALTVFVQRGRRGFAYQDLWALNRYLADVISKSVDQLRVQGTQQGWGRPGELTDDEWEDVLRRITAGMEAAKRLTIGRDDQDITADRAARADAFDLLVTWWRWLGS